MPWRILVLVFKKVLQWRKTEGQASSAPPPPPGGAGAAGGMRRYLFGEGTANAITAHSVAGAKVPPALALEEDVQPARNRACARAPSRPRGQRDCSDAIDWEWRAPSDGQRALGGRAAGGVAARSIND